MSAYTLNIYRYPESRFMNVIFIERLAFTLKFIYNMSTNKEDNDVQKIVSLNCVCVHLCNLYKLSSKCMLASIIM